MSVGIFRTRIIFVSKVGIQGFEIVIHRFKFRYIKIYNGHKFFRLSFHVEIFVSKQVLINRLHMTAVVDYRDRPVRRRPRSGVNGN